MVENQHQRDQSVRLNEAFARLEKQQSTSADRRSGNIENQDKSSSPVGVLAMLLALIAIGIGSYAAYIAYFNMPKNGDADIVALRTNVDALSRQAEARSGQIAKLQRQLEALSTNLANQDSIKQSDVDALEQRVEQKVADLKASLGTSSKDWLFAEVEYLLRLANQRVLMEGDVKGALALFHAADDIVRESEGITAFDLRQAIANNIAQLEAVSQIDVDGIFVRLAALASQVDQLRQRQHKYEPAAPQLTPVPAKATVTDKLIALLKRGGERLATLVDYRRNGEHIKPILPPREEYYLRQNLILKIQMAQLALLRGDQSVYATSLNEAQSWVVENFDPDDPVTTPMLKNLAELAAIKVDQKLPDVSGSLKAVRKLLAGFHQDAERGQPKE